MGNRVDAPFTVGTDLESWDGLSIGDATSIPGFLDDPEARRLAPRVMGSICRSPSATVSLSR